MYVFKGIDKSSSGIEQNITNYTQNLTTSSLGIDSINIVAASISSSYWDSLNVLFYASGSPVYGSESKFSSTAHSLAENDGRQFLNKFHGYPSSSIINIPQQYFGEKIKEGSFKLTDKSYTDNTSNNPIILDDKHGNLYSSNAHHSQSSATSISSSDNYVGNIFYDLGIVTITETGSWSGSVDYSDITNNSNYILQFDSYDTIFSHEYSVTLNPNEFNNSMNYTLKSPLSGSYTTMNEFTASLMGTQFLRQEFTGSNFQPYITEINLYQESNLFEPVIRAKLPKPIRKSDKIALTFKIKLDL
jgi:hypothetical protein